MAKARVSTNPIYQGGAGGYSFYSRGGEQIMRQRRNNSNYGEGASRSMAQQLRRVRWSNLVNLYKVMAPWQPRAYETKSKGQTDYNIFMSINANSSNVGLTKEMAAAGCAVVERVQVSRGSLPQIGRPDVAIEQVFGTDIVLSAAITPATTIAELSADIIAGNPSFVNGDNIGVAVFTNYKDTRDFPYAGCYYFELTLDVSNTSLLSSLPYGSRFVSGQVGTVGPLVLGVSWAIGSGDVGAAFVHTRRFTGGLKVSNAWIQVNGDAFWTDYYGQSWLEECAATYGIDTEVPLDPSFPDGFISSVTANGAVIARGATLTGSQVIRVSGSGASSPALRFVGNGVVYTPLVVGDGFVEFVLTANGTYELYVGNSPYIAFRVAGISLPTELSLYRRAELRQDSTNSSQGSVEMEAVEAACINYKHIVSESYPFIRCLIGISEDVVRDDFEAINFDIATFSSDVSNGVCAIVGSPVDASAVSYLSYDGLIIFVGNY